MNRIVWIALVALIGAAVRFGFHEATAPPRPRNRPAVVAAGQGAASAEGAIRGRVVAVLDGDTVTVLDNGEVVRDPSAIRAHNLWPNY